MELRLGQGRNFGDARSGAWESSDSGVAIISSRTKNMSVEGAQFVTFLKVESQRIEGPSGFVGLSIRSWARGRNLEHMLTEQRSVLNDAHRKIHAVTKGLEKPLR